MGDRMKGGAVMDDRSPEKPARLSEESGQEVSAHSRDVWAGRATWSVVPPPKRGGTTRPPG